ncbi:MAG: hypothetical protein R3C12_08535 [Planctomycetaceae bacterium]
MLTSMGAASNLIRGKTTGSAVLADFPEVECEILPYEKQSQRQSLPTDPTSVFTDFGTPAGAETSEVAANSPETEQTTPPASRNTRATFARGDTFERKPISGTSGINRIKLVASITSPGSDVRGRRLRPGCVITARPIRGDVPAIDLVGTAAIPGFDRKCGNPGGRD